MKTPRVFDARNSPDDVGRIADSVEAARTCRFAADIRIAGSRRESIIRQEGVWDFGRHLSFFRTAPVERVGDRFQAGPDVTGQHLEVCPG
jgi:hypothetical protein